jgi:Zn-dependent oligopeptidase
VLSQLQTREFHHNARRLARRDRRDRRFRDTVLALGGSRHPMEVFKDFRGRQPQPDALLRHSGLV